MEAAISLYPQGDLVMALWLRAAFEQQRCDAAARLCTPELRLSIAQAILFQGQRRR